MWGLGLGISRDYRGQKTDDCAVDASSVFRPLSSKRPTQISAHYLIDKLLIALHVVMQLQQ